MAENLEKVIEASSSVDPRSSEKSDVNNYEYETQHFGYTPISLLNGMFNAMCDLYREGLKAFCTTCSNKFPGVMSDEQLRQARHAVSQNIDNDISSVFDNLESYLLERVFVIPEHVVLPEDKCQILHCADSYDEAEYKKNELKKKIIAVKYANAQLTQHLDDAKAFQTTLDEVLKQMSEGNISQLGAKGIKDWLSYYSEQLKKLN